MRHESSNASDQLAKAGISVDLIDPRTIRPMDWDAIQGSVDKTGRLLVVEEAPRTGSVAAEILARVVERHRDRPIRVARLNMPDVIHPYSPEMEASILPTAADIVRAASDLCVR
jgi:pyruvate/2-oxoglutarate/acetoin dehydrogenase E1 component